MTPLRLAFTPFVLNPLLKNVSGIYKELIPDSEIFPTSEDTDEAVRRVRDGECDAALLTLPIREDGLEINVLESDRFVICMRNDDPLATLDAVPLNALDNKISDFVYQKHHPLAYERLKQMFAEADVRLRPCKPTTNIDHVQWMIQESGCCSLLRARRAVMPHLTTRPIADAEWSVDTAIICRLNHGNPALALLIEELKKRYDIRPLGAEKKPLVSVGGQSVTRSRKSNESKIQIPLFSIPSEG